MWIDPPYQCRRRFLANTAFGVGAVALAHLMRAKGCLPRRPSKPGENLPLISAARPPHFAPKATAMISLFMHGGPSHVDLLDPKPEFDSSTTAPSTGARLPSASSTGPARSSLPRPWKFAKHGQCGTEVSELLPETARIVDDLCVVRSMHTGHNGHEVSIRYFQGGIAGHHRPAHHGKLDRLRPG